MKDRLGRDIHYMRISITDRCNLRCRYCMPEDIETTAMSQLLTYEEIVRVVKAGTALGVTDYRITGGEPLVRKGCVSLVEMIKKTEGVTSVGMTTNGVLLKEYAQALKEAGLDSLNVSLDTLDSGEFERLTGRNQRNAVLSGIQAAKQADIPVKVNAVNRKNLDWDSLLHFGEEMGIPIRFIEMMPIGYGKKYVGMPNEELIDRIREKYGKETVVKCGYGNGPASYYHFETLSQNVGFISAVNHKFCDACNRIRLTSEGYLKLCLCYDRGVDLRSVLRSEKKAGQLREVMEQAIFEKPAEHSFLEYSKITEEREMNRIGG